MNTAGEPGKFHAIRQKSTWCTISPPTPELTQGLSLDLGLFVGAKDSKVSISRENLSNSYLSRPNPFYHYKLHDIQIGQGVVSVYNYESESSSHFETVYNVPTNLLGLLIIHNLLEGSKNPPERTPVYRARRIFMEYVQQWHFYNANYMNLETIRNSEPELGPGDIFVSPTGHNLALVIKFLR
jgi:hypothetical protein